MSHSTAPASAPHLLLVDDDRLILATVACGLRDAGYHTSTAECFDDVQALLARGVRPDLAILDMHLPGRDGLQLAQWLHELQHIPFIVLSAYSDLATVQRASQLGALGYMVKPLDISQIYPTVQAALLRATELQTLRQTSEQLQVALDGVRDINVATGIAMVQYRLQRDAAFELLRSSARAQRRKLSQLAQEVIQGCEKLHK